MHLPCLLADTADPSLLLLLIGAAVLADIILAVLALPLAIDEKSERGAAANATMLIKLLMLGKDAALVTLFIQLLLHFTGRKEKKPMKPMFCLEFSLFPTLLLQSLCHATKITFVGVKCTSVMFIPGQELGKRGLLLSNLFSDCAPGQVI